jgi:hypothetical protein
MKRVNGYVSFNRGDKIKLVDDNLLDKYKGKVFEFVEVNGEDYFFRNPKTNETFHIPARYFNKFKKVDEKIITKVIKTWELNYDKNIDEDIIEE